MSKWDTYRTYNGEVVNLSLTLNNIHQYLFAKNNISSRTKEDAELLTRFFKEVKRLSIHKENEKIEKEIKRNIISDELKDKIIDLKLDFTKGGQSIKGVEFEKEILKLFEEIFADVKEENFISGQNKSAVYIKQNNNEGTDTEMATAIIEDVLSDIEGHFKVYNSKLKNEIKMFQDVNFPIQITKKVDGKIDLKANSKATINIDISASASGELLRALNLIKNSSFSIKSYLSNDSPVGLGKTASQNAISAVAQYVAEKTGNYYINYVATFYRAHPKRPGRISKSDNKKYSAQGLGEIYNHYNHMRNVYELTGVGLRINEISDLYAVDFLLFNRANSSDIIVYSTQELIKKWDLQNVNKYKNHWQIDI